MLDNQFAVHYVIMMSTFSRNFLSKQNFIVLSSVLCIKHLNMFTTKILTDIYNGVIYYGTPVHVFTTREIEALWMVIVHWSLTYVLSKLLCFFNVYQAKHFNNDITELGYNMRKRCYKEVCMYWACWIWINLASEKMLFNFFLVLRFLLPLTSY